MGFSYNFQPSATQMTLNLLKRGNLKKGIYSQAFLSTDIIHSHRLFIIL